MGWLPAENKIAKLSEELILKYNPDWNGCNDYRHDFWVPDEYKEFFDIEKQEIFDVQVPFVRILANTRSFDSRIEGEKLNTMFSNKEILEIAMEQSAWDIGAKIEDFLNLQNVLVDFKLGENARKYLKEPICTNLNGAMLFVKIVRSWIASVLELMMAKS